MRPAPGIVAAASLRWCGADDPCLDEVRVVSVGHAVVGRYGGGTEVGAYKNEDAAFVRCGVDAAWTFAAVMDAHGGSESAAILLAGLDRLAPRIDAAMARSAPEAIPAVEGFVRSWLLSAEFAEAARVVCGETAVLFCAQTDGYVWWLSVGDVLAYAFHPEFAALGQFALNQRMFYEWVGEADSLRLPVPCFATGTRQLRAGLTRLALVTDGLLECGARPFEDPCVLAAALTPGNPEEAVRRSLERVVSEGGRDSATIVVWDVQYDGAPLQPSA